MNEATMACADGLLSEKTVLGRALGEWSVDETGDTLEAMFAWKHAVRSALPTHRRAFSDIVGTAFADAFEARYRALVREAQERQLDGAFVEGAARLGHDGAKVISRFLIPYGSWVPDHQYAVMECEGRRFVLGTVKGRWTLFGKAHILEGLARLKVQQDHASNALSLLDPQ